MGWPKISIVTCSFNQGEFLEETIRSVLRQAYPNLEYIIIDGGSTDGSLDIIRKYAGRLAFWVSEPDRGQTHALIKGFARSTGEIQAWLCSDDILESGALREVGQFFLQHPGAQVVYGDTSYIDRTGKVIKIKRPMGFCRWILLYEGNYIPQPSTFWRRELYEKVGGLDERFDFAMDEDLLQRFSEVTKIWHVGRLWSRFRIYPGAKSCNLGLEIYEEQVRILSRALGKPVRKIRQGVTRYLAGSVRFVSEEALSTIHWVGCRGEWDRPRDNPFLGLRAAYKRWVAFSQSYRKRMRQYTGREKSGRPLWPK